MTQVIDACPAPGPARWGPRVRKLVRFGVVGVASTVAYALLYLLFRQALDAFVANTLALLITAVANTAVNRRVTFRVSGRDGVLGDHAVGLAAFGVGFALTNGSLAALHAFSSASDGLHGAELVVLTVANLVSTLLRFAALQLRIGSRPSQASHHQAGKHAAQVVDGRAA